MSEDRGRIGEPLIRRCKLIAARLHAYDPTFSSPTPLTVESVRDPHIVADDDVLVKVVGACAVDRLGTRRGTW